MLCPYCLNEVESFNKSGGSPGSAVSYSCPKCPENDQHEIPLSYVTSGDRLPKIPISLIGKTGHGKTCYMSSLLHFLDSAGDAWRNFSYRALDEIEYARFRNSLEQIEKGTLPSGTSTTMRPRPLLLELETLPHFGSCQILIYDVGGAVFNQVPSIHEFAPYVFRSSAVVWLLSLCDLDAKHDLDEFLTTYLSALERLSYDPSRQTLVIALTKGDRLHEQQDMPESIQRILSAEMDTLRDGGSEMVSLSDDIEHWLEHSLGHRNFVRRISREFRQVRFCVTSALGANPSSRNELTGPIQPRAVFLPLWWVLFESVPKVLIETKDGEKKTRIGLHSAIEDPRVVRIQLYPGEYRIERPLEFNRPLSIEGAGRDVTRIVCDHGGYSAQASLPESSELHLSRLTITHRANIPADVFTIRSGRVCFTQCSFSGAKRAIRQGVGGAGVRVEGNSVVKLFHCVLSKNELTGLWAKRECRVEIKNTICTKNQRSGVTLSDLAEVDILNCRLVENGKYGIEALNESASHVDSCFCKSNGDAGIAFFDHAKGIADSNSCRKNKEGILVCDKAHVDLWKNQCNRNGNCGMRFDDHSSGKIKDSICDQNQFCGIEIGPNATPKIIAVECRRNGSIGILVKSGSFSLFQGARVGKFQCHGNRDYDFLDQRNFLSRALFGRWYARTVSAKRGGGG